MKFPSLIVLAFLFPLTGYAGDENIEITAFKLSRPAYFETIAGEKVRDFSFSREEFIRAGRQAVYFYDKDPVFDEFCGAFFTDLRGEIKGATLRCGDADDFWTGTYNPADLMVKVHAKSAKGIAVYKGTSVLGDHLLYKWSIDSGFGLKDSRGRSARSSGGRKYVSFGSWKIGQSGSRAEKLAASLLETLDWMYDQLQYTTKANPPASDWVLEFPFGNIFTHWNTVYVNTGSASSSWALKASGHELGHVLYNQMHSGRVHYEGEVLQYAHVHQRCLPVTETSATDPSDPEKFAQYEGHAQTTLDLLWFIETEKSRHFASPCSTARDDLRGEDIEGNIEAFYFWSLMGDDPSFARPYETLTENEFFDHEDGTFALRPVADHYLMVDRAGSGSHSVADMWEEDLEQVCRRSYQSTPLFCGTSSFQDVVNDDLMDSFF
ncbi:MAG: hypothetical protein Q7T11_06910 [Deltaproteobacteria bacterium]|nr:hypothetical protein [Deltaproteobacteria bacterium]